MTIKVKDGKIKGTATIGPWIQHVPGTHSFIQPVIGVIDGVICQFAEDEKPTPKKKKVTRRRELTW